MVRLIADQIHDDLIFIADGGEYEDMRREVERYFEQGEFDPELIKQQIENDE